MGEKKGPFSAQLRVPNKGAGATLQPPRQRTFADAWSSVDPALRKEEEEETCLPGVSGEH